METDEKKLVKAIEELRRLLKKKETNLAELRRERDIIQIDGLRNEEIRRYSRHILIPEIGVQEIQLVKLLEPLNDLNLTQPFYNDVNYDGESHVL